MTEATALEMALLGVAVSVFMLVPLVGFFVRALLGASVCHLSMRSAAKRQMQSE